MPLRNFQLFVHNVDGLRGILRKLSVALTEVAAWLDNFPMPDPNWAAVQSIEEESSGTERSQTGENQSSEVERTSVLDE